MPHTLHVGLTSREFAFGARSFDHLRKRIGIVLIMRHSLWRGVVGRLSGGTRDTRPERGIDRSGGIDRYCKTAPSEIKMGWPRKPAS